jgi:hypothetical protein
MLQFIYDNYSILVAVSIIAIIIANHGGIYPKIIGSLAHFIIAALALSSSLGSYFLNDFLTSREIIFKNAAVLAGYAIIIGLSILRRPSPEVQKK